MPPFTVYYGHDSDQVSRLTAFELAIVESRGWKPDDWQTLRQSSTKLIGYLSPFAWPDWLGPSKWWWGSKQRDPEWNAWWYSLSSWGWRKRVGQMWRELPEGLDGLFFDNIDRLQKDPASLKPLRRLLAEIRSHKPDAILIGNRGFDHWPHLQSHLDGILFENLTDRAFSASDKRWVESQLENLRGTKVYALDYDTRKVPPEAQRLNSLYSNMQYYAAPDESLQTINL